MGSTRTGEGNREESDRTSTSARTSDLYAFGPYRLDVGGRILAREGQPVPLPPKTFELLLLMAESPGRAFSKQELMSALWPDVFVEEANLSFQVSMLRKALGEGGGPWIETVPKHGYRFTADVKKIPAAAAATIPAMTTAPVTTAATAITRTPLRQQLGLRLVWLVVGALAVGAGLWALGTFRPLAERHVVRLAIPLSPEETVFLLALSPDGTHLAYMAARGGHSQIYLRALDQLQARPIPGTEEGVAPFFSPDGRWLGFTDLGQSRPSLKKVLLAGGAPVFLCDVSSGTGASWGPDGTIVVTRDMTSGLFRVSADGGTPQALTVLDAGRHENSHRFPDVLPGGQGVVFTVKTDDALSWDDARIEAISLRTGERSILITGGAQARYAAGSLVYHRKGSLWAVPFDPVRLKVTGPPLLVLEGVSSTAAYGRVAFDISEEGSLAYLPGKPRGTDRGLVRVDREGRRKPLTDLRRAFGALSLSPDGGRLALQINGPNDQIWVYDLDRGTLTPQTLRGVNRSPIWTPDGRRLTFTSNREGTGWNLLWQPADGSGPAERLTSSANEQFPSSWSPDGKILFFTEGPDVLILERDRDQKPRPFLHGRITSGVAVVSPNGRWLAYASDESGREEVYVRPFPGPGSRWTVSTDGGGEPVWARNGQELFYRNRDRIMAVTVTSDATFTTSKPRVLFEAKAPLRDVDASFGVMPNGDFLMIEPGESDTPPAQINVVLNWVQELRQHVVGR